MDERIIPLLRYRFGMDQALQEKPAEASPALAHFAWTAWLTAICGTFLIFVILTWLILVPGIADFDLSCAQAMKEHAQDHPAARQFFWLITWIGGSVALAILALTGTSILL